MVCTRSLARILFMLIIGSLRHDIHLRRRYALWRSPHASDGLGTMAWDQPNFCFSIGHHWCWHRHIRRHAIQQGKSVHTTNGNHANILQTKNFSTGHQIFGLVVMLALIAQFILGFMHHRIWKKTQAPTKMISVHVWLGPLVIIGGIANGFS
jgi:hypothetical protein